MKKIFSILSIALVAAFADPEGKLVDVELLSGTHQRAKLMGIENDTVSLGGYIQNKFTIVKIAKKQFKRIVDEQGNDLLNADNTQGNTAQKEPATKDPVAQAPTSSSAAATSSAAKDTVAKPVQSSSSNAPKEPSSSSIVKSSSSVASSSAVSSSSNFSSSSVTAVVKPEIKTVLVAYDTDNVEKSFADQFTALTARLLFESGEKPQIIRKTDLKNCNDNVCIQSELAAHGFNSIYFGEITPVIGTDSLRLNLTHVFYEDSLPTLHRATLTISEETALGDAITNNKLKNQLLDAQGKDIVKSKKDRAYIHIDTDPDGATISRTNKDAICKSPCTFVTTDTSKFTIHAYWNVDRHLWGASTSVVPLIGDTTHISLKLKRVTPEIRIQTFPEGANVYKAGAPITKRTKAIAQTPEKIPVYEMGMDTPTSKRQAEGKRQHV